MPLESEVFQCRREDPADNSHSNETTWTPPPHLERSSLVRRQDTGRSQDTPGCERQQNRPSTLWIQGRTRQTEDLFGEGRAFDFAKTTTTLSATARSRHPSATSIFRQRRSSSASITTYLCAGASRATRTEGQACRDEQRTMPARKVSPSSDKDCTKHKSHDKTAVPMSSHQTTTRTKVKAIATNSKMPGFPSRGPGTQFFWTDATAAAQSLALAFTWRAVSVPSTALPWDEDFVRLPGWEAKWSMVRWCVRWTASYPEERTTGARTGSQMEI